MIGNSPLVFTLNSCFLESQFISSLSEILNPRLNFPVFIITNSRLETCQTHIIVLLHILIQKAGCLLYLCFLRIQIKAIKFCSQHYLHVIVWSTCTFFPPKLEWKRIPCDAYLLNRHGNFVSSHHISL